MLIQLNIKQFGIIESATIELKNGLTVLSGETGAGKSMILAAISQLSGQRTSTSYIRYGEEKASVEGVFDFPKNKEVINIFKDLDLDLEDEVIIIRRDIYSSGKSVCRINGTIVNLSTLKKVAVYLLDMHEQHDNQILLVEKNHLNLIDSFNKEEIKKVRTEYKEKYKEYKVVTEKIENLKQQESDILQKVDFLKFQYQELTQMKLKKDEDISLEKDIDYLENFEKVNTLAYSITDGIDGEYGILSKLAEIKSNLGELSRYNSNFEEKYEEITNLYYILDDLKYEVSSYTDDIEYDEEKLDRLIFRMDKIKNLEKKYSRSLNDLIIFREEIKEELEELENYEENYDKYIVEQKNILAELKSLGDKLTTIRKKTAQKLESLIQEELKFLYMDKSTIKVDFKDKEYASDGKDDVRILISANLGEPLKSLSKVASGGELSRVMLALKIIFSRSIEATSIIFDEIDTGVSGRVSQRMAEKMYQLGIGSQVLCISHLPQTTALADTNLLISKEVIDKRTLTSIKELDRQQKIEEVARMISGDKMTRLSEEHAIEMLKLAEKTKEEIKTKKFQ
ncbi:MAG: DNA repair protein RecN [Gemella morbillorum]|uniref:DNA repair protein RecN n=1 Tax=Gemella morbillorum TaxID=29391 RepID=UPI001CB39E2E|nr:DNA repair protein RecN [Gemella morbillorum]MBF1209089.1 DNA repair protein RecN [Gemella morbillorum]